MAPQALNQPAPGKKGRSTSRGPLPSPAYVATAAEPAGGSPPQGLPAEGSRAVNAVVNAGVGLALAGAAAGLLGSHTNLVDLYTTSVAADPVGTKVGAGFEWWGLLLVFVLAPPAPAWPAPPIHTPAPHTCSMSWLQAVVSGTVYFLGDLIAQSLGEGRSIGDWDRLRALRSGLVGLLAHGPLSHCYYLALDSLCQHSPLADGNGIATLVFKVGIDQTLWSLSWNALYCALLGLLKREEPADIARDVRATAWPLLKAGWRVWPLVHLITYGLLPVQHRLLFVDSVELAWVAVLSLTCAARSDEGAAAQPAAPAPPAADQVQTV